MSLEAWEKLGKLRKHEPSPREIRDLVCVVERELEYARAISRGAKFGEEGEFNHAYEAARTLAKIALAACGYRAQKHEGSHYYPIESMRHTIGLDSKKVAYLHSCTTIRGTSMYDRAGTISERAAKELVNFTIDLEEVVLKWVRAVRPDLLNEIG